MGPDAVAEIGSPQCVALSDGAAQSLPDFTDLFIGETVREARQDRRQAAFEFLFAMLIVVCRHVDKITGK